MPSSTSRRTIARQWELLKQLPGKGPGLSAAELCGRLQSSGHQVSKRTIERDLVELSQLFPLQCNDKGIPYGWHWMPGTALDMPGISLSEALTLRLVEGSLRALMPHPMLSALEPRFQQAQQKLENLSEEVPAARWLDKVASVTPALTLLPPAVDEQHLECIQQALLQDRQLDCRYYSAHRDQHRQLTLNPLALVQRGQVTYLLATAEPWEDIRQFVLHRFSHTQLLETPCNTPAGFSLPNYLDSGAMQFGTPKQITLDAWISNGLARLLSETPLSPDMTLTPTDHGTTLTATVNDSWELRWWILSHAGSIRINQPEDLAAEILGRLREAVSLHAQDNQQAE